ncbi:MAG: hypothetical protein IPK13_09375 [Deltaproteobacteria bacterium]|nr:hypothetical protein [Deltaproteobacteria bacterium]
MLLVERALLELDRDASAPAGPNRLVSPSPSSAAVELGARFSPRSGLGWSADDAEGPTLHGSSAVEEAIMALERVILLSPRHFEALGGLAELHLRCGRPKDADRYLRRAVALGFRPRDALIRALERTHGLDVEGGS